MNPFPLFRRLGLRLVLGALALWSGLLVSCVMTGRTMLAPPAVPGATFVGAQACTKCHTDIARGFHDATHAGIVMKAANGAVKNISCESCHGPASLHIKAGTRATIVNPKISPDTCIQCHPNTRAEFSLPFTHPVLAGKIACTNCHNPHEGEAHAADAGARTLVAATNATCAKCHPAQTGPFVFGHEVMRDGCVACHAPHGSVNDKMLKSRGTSLCYQCHFQPQSSGVTIMHGGVDHSSNVLRGTCWSAGCHEAVHGSNVNSSLRF